MEIDRITASDRNLGQGRSYELLEQDAGRVSSDGTGQSSLLAPYPSGCLSRIDCGAAIAPKEGLLR